MEWRITGVCGYFIWISLLLSVEPIILRFLASALILIQLTASRSPVDLSYFLLARAFFTLNQENYAHTHGASADIYQIIGAFALDARANDVDFSVLLNMCTFFQAEWNFALDN